MKRKKPNRIRKALAIFCFVGVAVYICTAFFPETPDSVKAPLFITAGVFVVLGIMLWPKQRKQHTDNSAVTPADLDAARAAIARVNTALEQLEQQDGDAAIDNDCYVIVAALDDETCELCGDMDGRVFLTSQYVEGVTAPPFHEGCRCCTAPYFEDMQGVGERAARNPKTGQTFYVPAGMTYKEFKKQYLDKK